MPKICDDVTDAIGAATSPHDMVRRGMRAVFTFVDERPEEFRLLYGEGVRRIAVVSDDPGKYPSRADFADGTTFHHRDDLDALQRELREVEGCSVIIYDQTCAAEKRRRRSSAS